MASEENRPVTPSSEEPEETVVQDAEHSAGEAAVQEAAAEIAEDTAELTEDTAETAETVEEAAEETENEETAAEAPEEPNAEASEEPETAPAETPKKGLSKGARISIIIAAAVLVLGALAAGVFWFLSAHPELTAEKVETAYGDQAYLAENTAFGTSALTDRDRYDITEEDFLSAELEVVPSFEACDIGVDRSFIGGYGQDDRVCAYAELKAIFDTETPDRTAVCVLADKEEIGSMGVSGMQSRAFETFMADLCEQQDVHLRDCFENSFCVSADVCNAYDPTFWEVSEYPNRNGARANYGVGICKFTGARGKSGTSDASAEIVGYLRRIFADAGVVWQMSELGKVDQGGGGTVAQYMANRNIDTIDAGTPVFSMHAPFETVTKFDCYQTYKAMWAFYKDR